MTSAKPNVSSVFIILVCQSCNCYDCAAVLFKYKEQRQHHFGCRSRSRQIQLSRLSMPRILASRYLIDDFILRHLSSGFLTNAVSPFPNFDLSQVSRCLSANRWPIHATSPNVTPMHTLRMTSATSG